MVDNPLPIIALIFTFSFVLQLAVERYARIERLNRLSMRKNAQTLLFISNPCFNGYIGEYAN